MKQWDMKIIPRTLRFLLWRKRRKDFIEPSGVDFVVHAAATKIAIGRT